MKTRSLVSSLLILASLSVATVNAQHAASPQHAQQAYSMREARSDVRVRKTPDLVLTAASVTYLADMDMLIFEQKVQGVAGGTRPRPRGELNGAPVPGYVFPTTLKSQDVGFSPTEGVVALAVTSHPDFDDSPCGTRTTTGVTTTTAWCGIRTGSC